jgi:serine/threonine protein kinase
MPFPNNPNYKIKESIGHGHGGFGKVYRAKKHGGA